MKGRYMKNTRFLIKMCVPVFVSAISVVAAEDKPTIRILSGNLAAPFATEGEYYYGPLNGLLDDVKQGPFISGSALKFNIDRNKSGINLESIGLEAVIDGVTPINIQAIDVNNTDFGKIKANLSFINVNKDVFLGSVADLSGNNANVGMKVALTNSTLTLTGTSGTNLGLNVGVNDYTGLKRIGFIYASAVNIDAANGGEIQFENNPVYDLKNNPVHRENSGVDFQKQQDPTINVKTNFTIGHYHVKYIKIINIGDPNKSKPATFCINIGATGDIDLLSYDVRYPNDRPTIKFQREDAVLKLQSGTHGPRTVTFHQEIVPQKDSQNIVEINSISKLDTSNSIGDVFSVKAASGKVASLGTKDKKLKECNLTGDQPIELNIPIFAKTLTNLEKRLVILSKDINANMLFKNTTFKINGNINIRGDGVLDNTGWDLARNTVTFTGKSTFTGDWNIDNIYNIISEQKRGQIIVADKSSIDATGVKSMKVNIKTEGEVKKGELYKIQYPIVKTEGDATITWNTAMNINVEIKHENENIVWKPAGLDQKNYTVAKNFTVECSGGDSVIEEPKPDLKPDGGASGGGGSDGNGSGGGTNADGSGKPGGVGGSDAGGGSHGGTGTASGGAGGSGNAGGMGSGTLDVVTIEPNPNPGDSSGAGGGSHGGTGTASGGAGGSGNAGGMGSGGGGNGGGTLDVVTIEPNPNPGDSSGAGGGSHGGAGTASGGAGGGGNAGGMGSGGGGNGGGTLDVVTIEPNPNSGDSSGAGGGSHGGTGTASGGAGGSGNAGGMGSGGGGNGGGTLDVVTIEPNPNSGDSSGAGGGSHGGAGTASGGAGGSGNAGGMGSGTLDVVTIEPNPNPGDSSGAGGGSHGGTGTASGGAGGGGNAGGMDSTGHADSHGSTGHSGTGGGSGDVGGIGAGIINMVAIDLNPGGSAEISTGNGGNTAGNIGTGNSADSIGINTHAASAITGTNGGQLAVSTPLNDQGFLYMATESNTFLSDIEDGSPEMKAFSDMLLGVDNEANNNAGRLKNALGSMRPQERKELGNRIISSNAGPEIMRQSLSGTQHVLSNRMTNISSNTRMLMAVAGGSDDNNGNDSINGSSNEKLGVWVQPFYSQAQQKRRDEVSGYKVTAGGGESLVLITKLMIVH